MDLFPSPDILYANQPIQLSDGRSSELCVSVVLAGCCFLCFQDHPVAPHMSNFKADSFPTQVQWPR